MVPFQEGFFSSPRVTGTVRLSLPRVTVIWWVAESATDTWERPTVNGSSLSMSP